MLRAHLRARFQQLQPRPALGEHQGVQKGPMLHVGAPESSPSKDSSCYYS